LKIPCGIFAGFGQLITVFYGANSGSSEIFCIIGVMIALVFKEVIYMEEIHLSVLNFVVLTLTLTLNLKIELLPNLP
jgi:hypothetical protein